MATKTYLNTKDIDELFPYLFETEFKNIKQRRNDNEEKLNKFKTIFKDPIVEVKVKGKCKVKIINVINFI